MGLIFGSKIRNSRQKISSVKKSTVLNRCQRVDSTHKQAVATARMSSETAPVSEPVYEYSDDKHVAAAACVENWNPTLELARCARHVPATACVDACRRSHTMSQVQIFQWGVLLPAVLRCFGNNLFTNTSKKSMAIQHFSHPTTWQHDYIKSLFENPGRPLTSLCTKKNAN